MSRAVLPVIVSIALAPGCLDLAGEELGESELGAAEQALCPIDQECEPGPLLPPPPPPPRPDLASGYTSVLSPQTFLSTTPIAWGFKVCNKGTAPAAGFHVATSIISRTFNLTIASQSVYVPGLAAGECYPWYGGSFRFGSGAYATVAAFDSAKVVVESNESNNVYQFWFNVQ